MKMITALHAVTALAALSFAGQAFAMGGGMMQGNSARGNHNMGSRMQQGGTSSMRHGSHNGTGGRHETMHETGTRHGGMNEAGQHSMMNNGAKAGGSDAQPAAPAAVAAQPVKN